MNLPEFENLLLRTMGLDAASISPAMIERAVLRRLQARGLGLDWAAYWELVQSSEAELQELIEEVIVPETWFFRDREAFAFLVRLAIEEWPKTRPEGPARLLSLPCSTGEEPHTMAMALFDAGLAADRFQIDAVDISRRSLAAARRGTYGRNSFRGDDLGFRDRFFTPAGREWQLDARVRGQVRCKEGNLFSPTLLAGEAGYDVVFCRNVLIYFDRDSQMHAMEILRRRLAPEGVLFVGPSETSLASEGGFAPIRVPQAFAFRKTRARAAKAAALPPPAPAHPVPAVPVPPPARRPFSNLPPARAQPAAQITEDTLAGARLLADQGRLPEAMAQCEAQMETRGPSVEVYYLMGVVCDAMRRHGEAAMLYRKALYLNPEHGGVLAHLASLLESQGDAAGARVLNERARRIAAGAGAVK